MNPIQWLLVVVIFVCFDCYALTIPDRDSLRMRILEFDRQFGNLIQVLTSKNSDIIYGEDVGGENTIILECRSSYGPVEFSYKGDGAPQITSNTNTTRTGQGLYFWSFLSFTRHPRAYDSGNYTCITIDNPNLQNSVHLYVPDSSKAVFVPSRLTSRIQSPLENHLRVPCSVVHPAARVTLERLSQDYRSNGRDKITYSPKSGFYVPISMVNLKTETTFLCKASFRGKTDEIEYKILFEPPKESDAEYINPVQIPQLLTTTTPPQSFPGLRSACTKSTCGENAECIVVDYAAHCVCMEDFTGDPFTRCFRMSQQSQKYASQEDPCTPSPCGSNHPCIVVNNHAVCTCTGSHLGTPTICKLVNSSPTLIMTSLCRRNEDCALEEYCNVRGMCESICNGTSKFCGENSICKHKDHKPFCECSKGYKGNPYISRENPGCKLFKATNNNELRKPVVGLCNQTTLCGEETKCKIRNGQVKCRPSFGEEERKLDAIKICGSSCGPNSICTLRDSKVFCKCAPNAIGFPPNCTHKPMTPKCRDNLDCSDDAICDRQKCVNPCSWMCSNSAICKVTNHVVSCKCPQGEEGDPRFGCKKAKLQATTVQHSCQINCGPNTICRQVMFNDLENYRNTLRQSRQEALFFDMLRANGNLNHGVYSECLCRKRYTGNPYSVSGCQFIAEQEDRTEYPVTILMEPDPCNPSPCGRNSFCKSYRGKSFCTCDFDSSGQPPNCRHRCQTNFHCMFDEDECVNGVCQSINNPSTTTRKML